VNSIAGLRRMTLLWAQERHRGLGDGASVVDGVIGLGRGRWCIGFGEDSTMAQRHQGGLDDGTGSEEVDNGTGSKEILDGKFW
jgi:hypothetical protein